MSEQPRAGHESYSIADEQAQIEYVGVRRAEQWTPFLLPHLRPGQRLLDVGCGVGSITLDLAARVAPGEVVGVDQDDHQLSLARAAATERGLTNARFQVGSVYDLPFADGSFDVALAHTLLFHLSDQLRALKELRRVLAPGGLVAVADDHYGTWVFSPEGSAVQRIITQLVSSITVASGGNPYYSHNLRHLLLEAGFARTEGLAIASEHYGALTETRRLAGLLARVTRNPEMRALFLAQGLVSEDELEALRTETLAWGERPDAFAAVMYCVGLGWVDEPASRAL